MLVMVVNDYMLQIYIIFLPATLISFCKVSKYLTSHDEPFLGSTIVVLSTLVPPPWCPMLSARAQRGSVLDELFLWSVTQPAGPLKEPMPENVRWQRLEYEYAMTTQ